MSCEFRQLKIILLRDKMLVKRIIYLQAKKVRATRYDFFLSKDLYNSYFQTLSVKKMKIYWERTRFLGKKNSVSCQQNTPLRL